MSGQNNVQRQKTPGRWKNMLTDAADQRGTSGIAGTGHLNLHFTEDFKEPEYSVFPDEEPFVPICAVIAFQEGGKDEP